MNSRAFTLVETLVAIAIIMVVLAAPFHTAEEAINASYISRDELTANSLAQEGVEYVRSIRDTDYLYNVAFPSTPVHWLGGLDGTAAAPAAGTFSANCVSPAICTVDPINSVVFSCPSQNCSAYPLDLGTSAYTYPYVYNQAGAGAQNIATRFLRTVQLTNLSANEVKVTVIVTWTTEGVAHTTTINEYLQNYL